MTIRHVFLHFPDLDPGVPTVPDLEYALREDRQTAYVISDAVAGFIKDAIIFSGPKINFARCGFALDNGKQFLEFDGKGHLKILESAPAWYVPPAEFARDEWLKTHELADLAAPDFINAFIEMFPNLDKRRKHADLLFDLSLEPAKSVMPSAPSAAVSKLGNKHGKTTAPRVTDLQSFELFSQFVERLKAALQRDQFPTLQVLADSDDVAKLPASLKQAYRTWYKAITHEQPPNNKKVGAGRAELYCAPMRERVEQIELIGREHYYQALSAAIKQAGDLTIAQFTFDYNSPAVASREK